MISSFEQASQNRPSRPTRFCPHPIAPKTDARHEISADWVESGAGAPVLGSGGWSIAFALGLSPAPITAFPGPRSSNRTCRFPASGFPMRSCLRPRKALGRWPKADKTVVLPQPFVRKAHLLPAPHLVLPTQPLSQPLRRVSIDRAIRPADLAKTEVLGPTG